MAEGSVECELSVSADEAWAAVGNFNEVEAVFPGLDSFEVEGEDRIIGMFGMKIRERLYELDNEGRRLVYGIVDGVPVEHHRGTITVTENGTGSKITWAYDVEPPEMAEIMGGTYAGALEQIKKHFGEA
jgi:carbon monoxide dehydrogenase subunit G